MLSGVLFAVMPGIVWLASMALIETMLIFVFCVSILFFFRWLKNNRERDLTLSIAALIIGVVVKYQILVVAPIIMVVSVFVFGKGSFLKTHAERFVQSKRLWIGVLLAVLAALLLFELYASGLLNVCCTFCRWETLAKHGTATVSRPPYSIFLKWFGHTVISTQFRFYMG